MHFQLWHDMCGLNPRRRVGLTTATPISLCVAIQVFLLSFLVDENSGFACPVSLPGVPDTWTLDRQGDHIFVHTTFWLTL